MTYRIKDLSNAAAKCIRSIGRYKPYDKGRDRNDRIMKTLFNRTMNGTIKGFYLVDEKSFKAYTRSTKEERTIQYSYGFYKNGELIPCGDVQMHTVKDLIDEGYSNGIYAEIGGNNE